ncbi:MAG: molecular chaperone DnaJ [Acidobacteria bacterium]|nr:molecular chaperone DnaJ [Acidobacteriota bacterium]MYD71583.1 molecular chaperone DnaJ [Acidobacteriota bacterium]MYJ06263.1 molecular chaperone DnaJ [Acidobacteriota bacterium]
MSARDYYEVLGVSRDVDEQSLKRAYRKLALQHHPDRNPNDAEAEARFKEAAEAYAVLADPEKRARYDRFGHAGVRGAGAGGIDPSTFADFNDIFSGLGDLFGFGDVFGGGTRRRQGPIEGSDLRYDLQIPLEEAAVGHEATLRIPREEACDDCSGSGAAPGTGPERCAPCGGRGQVRSQHGFLTVARPCSRCGGSGQVIATPCVACRGRGRTTQERTITVRVPAGVDSGQRLRIVGEGEHGLRGGPAGDLYVVVHVKEHPVFRRDGAHLLCGVSTGFPTLALGGEVTVPTLNGDATLKVPKGTQPGERFRLRGKGLPHMQGRGQGDLYVDLKVQVPKRLSSEQKRLIEALRETMPGEGVARAHDLAGTERDDTQDDDRPFLDRMKDIFG